MEAPEHTGTHPCAGEPDARQRLMQAAVQLFNRKGYSATSVREIVEAAGVTKPVLYYYFSSKEGIFHAAVENALALFHQRVAETLSQPGSVRERIELLCLTVYDAFVNYIEIPRLILQMLHGPQEGMPSLPAVLFPNPFIQRLNQLVREGIDRGELRDVEPEIMTETLAGVVQIALNEQMTPTPPRVGREHLPRMLELAFDGLAMERKP